MEEMVERVARALAAADDEVFGPETPFFCDYPGMARAAIAAMREPTAGMVTAGRAEIKPDHLPADDGDAKAAWRAMVDAALGEKGDG